MGRQPLFTSDQVLSAINNWVAKHGMPPTVKELTAALRLGSVRTTVRYLDQLEAEGLLERTGGARGIKALRSSGFDQDTRPVPIVGTAPAGALMAAEQNIEGWVRLPLSMLGARSTRFFLLRVRGNSMNKAKIAGKPIENGDLVLVRQQVSADNGNVVVALVDGQATIKRLAIARGYAVLKPDSSEGHHEPIVIGPDFRIQGVITDVLKNGSEILHILEQ